MKLRLILLSMMLAVTVRAGVQVGTFDYEASNAVVKVTTATIPANPVPLSQLQALLMFYVTQAQFNYLSNAVISAGGIMPSFASITNCVSTAFSSTTFVQVVNMALTNTTSGGAVAVDYNGDTISGDNNDSLHVRLLVDAQTNNMETVSFYPVAAGEATRAPIFGHLILTNLAAGQHTVSLQARLDSGATAFSIPYVPNSSYTCLRLTMQELASGVATAVTTTVNSTGTNVAGYGMIVVYSGANTTATYSVDGTVVALVASNNNWGLTSTQMFGFVVVRGAATFSNTVTFLSNVTFSAGSTLTMGGQAAGNFTNIVTSGGGLTNVTGPGLTRSGNAGALSTNGWNLGTFPCVGCISNMALPVTQDLASDAHIPTGTVDHLLLITNSSGNRKVIISVPNSAIATNIFEFKNTSAQSVFLSTSDGGTLTTAHYVNGQCVEESTPGCFFTLPVGAHIRMMYDGDLTYVTFRPGTSY